MTPQDKYPALMAYIADRSAQVEWWGMDDKLSWPETLDPAKHYLELRGLLIRHPLHPELDQNRR